MSVTTAEQRDAAKDAVLAALSDVVQVSPDPSSAPAPHASGLAAPASRSGNSSRAARSSPLNPASQPDGAAPAVPGKDAPLPSPPADAKKQTFGGRFAQAFRKHGEDKETKRRAKETRMREEINKSSQKLSRMDIIDRLDASAITGASMFHHDSPYDAVSAHRNKNSKRAPVMAFDPNIDPMTGQPWKHGQQRNAGASSSRQNLTPLAQSTLAHMDAKDPTYGADASSSAVNVAALGMYDAHASGSTPVRASGAAAAEHPDHNADAERAWRNEQGYWTQPSTVPSSRHDVSNPNADVWGVSAEPWQDFASPKARVSSNGGLSPHTANGAARNSSDNRSGLDSCASSVLDMEAIMTGNTSKKDKTEHRSGLANEVASGDGASGSRPPERDWRSNSNDSADAAPKRSKSLIKRIKSVRQSPNVPMLDDQADEPARARGGRRGAHGGSAPVAPPFHRATTDSTINSSSYATAGPASRPPPVRGDSGSKPGRQSGLFRGFGASRTKTKSPVLA